MYLYIHMHYQGSYICVSVCVAYLQERSTNKRRYAASGESSAGECENEKG